MTRHKAITKHTTPNLVEFTFEMLFVEDLHI